MLMTFMRASVTVLLLVLYVLLCLRAWSRRRREEFTLAARLPFDEGELRGDEARGER